MKTCSSCKQDKPLEDYTSNKYKKDGLSATCRKCECLARKIVKMPAGKTYKDYLKEAGMYNYYKKSIKYQV